MNNIILNKTLTVIVMILSIIISFFIFKKLFFILLPFYIGYLISKLFIPVITKLNIKHKHLKTLIIFILIFLFIISISFILTSLGKAIITFLSENIVNNNSLKESISIYYNELLKNTIDLPFNLTIRISSIIENSIKSFNNFLISKSQLIVENSFRFLKFLPQILVFIIITFISAFFFTKDNKKLHKYYNDYFQKYTNKIKNNYYYKLLRNDILKVFLGYLKAQLILMSITFVIASISFFIIGIDNFLIKSLAISIIDALPIFGTAIILIPWILSKIILKNYFHAISLSIIYLILTTTRQSLEPKIFSSQIGLYPLVTLFSIYAGLKTLGVMGIFIGPILVITLQTFIKFKEKHERF